jgi:hypothetical protein
MTPLRELAAQVLLGTERRPLALPALAGALGDVVEAACPPDMDASLRALRTAGIMSVYADAGWQPTRAEADLPAICPPEPLPLVTDPALLSALQQIFDAGPALLCHEALQKLASNSTCLPPALLPRVLSLGQKNPALRPALLPVLGQRGLWLAKLNPAWSDVIAGPNQAPDMMLWEQSTLEQRKHLLERLRETDPDRARGLLQDGFSQLDARERAALLEPIGTGIGPADEDFLEALLGDRSKEVRQLAGNLLARLPSSRYLARMAERMAACLRHDRKLFREVLVVTPPEKFGADWKDDGLEQTRPKSESLGERAWWLYQIARALPLAWWPAHTGMAPADLTKWAMGTDWSEALFRAWGEVLMRQPDAAWATAFLTHAPLIGLSADVFDLLACLPLAEREQHWLRMLEAGPKKIARGDLLGRIVQDCSPGGVELSAGFASRVLREIRSALHTDSCKWDYALRKTLPEFVCLIPPACFADATQGWPAASPETEYFSETLARILAVVELRKTLNRSPSQRK